MTVSRITAVSTLTETIPAGAGRTAFAYTKPVFDNDDFIVSLVAADGTETIQTLGTDYSVAIANNRGTITFSNAPAAGNTVRIIRNVKVEQPIRYASGTLPGPVALETNADRFAAAIQDLDRRLTEGGTGGGTGDLDTQAATDLFNSLTEDYAKTADLTAKLPPSRVVDNPQGGRYVALNSAGDGFEQVGAPADVAWNELAFLSIGSYANETTGVTENNFAEGDLMVVTALSSSGLLGYYESAVFTGRDFRQLENRATEGNTNWDLDTDAIVLNFRSGAVYILRTASGEMLINTYGAGSTYGYSFQVNSGGVTGSGGTETGAQIAAKLNVLTGEDRVSYTALKGLPTTYGASAVRLVTTGFNGNLDANVTNVQQLADAVDSLSVSGGGGSPDTAAQIVTKLQSLSGNARLSASAIQGLPVAETDAQIAAGLNALTGTNRLQGGSISLNASGFTTNLDSNVTTVQALANAVDALNLGSGSGTTTGQTAQQVLNAINNAVENFAKVSNVAKVPSSKVSVSTGTTNQYLKYGNPTASFATIAAGEVSISRTNLNGNLSSNTIVDVQDVVDAVDNLSLGQLNETGAQIAAKLNALTTDSEKVNYNNLQNLPTIPTADTAAQIKAKLETLMGTARLEASAIQNLPSSSGDGQDHRVDLIANQMQKIADLMRIIEPSVQVNSVDYAHGFSQAVEFGSQSDNTKNYTETGITATTAGTGDSAIRTFSGLTGSAFKVVGVSSPTTRTLLNLIDGLTTIPMIRRTTVSGVPVFQINNRKPAGTAGQPEEVTRSTMPIVGFVGRLEGSDAPGVVVSRIMNPVVPPSETLQSRRIDTVIRWGSATNVYHDYPTTIPVANNIVTTVWTTLRGFVNSVNGRTVTLQYRFFVEPAGQQRTLFQIRMNPSTPLQGTELIENVSFIHQIDTYTSLSATDNWQTVSNESGAINLGIGEASLIVQFEPAGNANRAVPVVRTASGTIVQANDISLSYSSFQPMWTSFSGPPGLKAITNTMDSVLRHSALASALESHRNDDWVFGYADRRSGTETRLTDSFDVIGTLKINGVDITTFDNPDADTTNSAIDLRILEWAQASNTSVIPSAKSGSGAVDGYILYTDGTNSSWGAAPTAETGAQIAAKLNALTTDSEKVDYDNLQNLPTIPSIPSTYAGTAISINASGYSSGNLNTGVTTAQLLADAVNSLDLGEDNETGAQIAAKLNLLTGNERIRYGAISGTPSAETGATIVTKLSGLTGDNRLPASAIRDLSTTGGSDQGFRYRFAVATAEGAASSGFIRFNSATISSITAIYISNDYILSNNTGASISALLNRLNGGMLYIYEADDPDDFFLFNITGIATTSISVTLTGTVVERTINSAFANNTDLQVIPYLAGGGSATAETGAEIATKLNALTGSDRINYSAIQNTPTIPAAETGPTIKTKLELLTGNARLNASAINGIPAAETGASIVTKLGTLSGNARLPASSVRDIPAETGATIVTKLSGLSGTNRLPASAVRDLPAGGGDIAYNFTFSAATTAVGITNNTGQIAFNNASTSNTTSLFLSASNGSTSYANLQRVLLGASGSSSGVILLTNKTSANSFVSFEYNGDVTLSDGKFTIPVSNARVSGSLSTGDELTLTAIPAVSGTGIKASLEALTGNNRLASSAIQGLSDVETGATIKSKLELLQSTARLDGDAVQITASGFSGNLNSGITDVQLLAAAVDGLTISSGGGGGSGQTIDTLTPTTGSLSSNTITFPSGKTLGDYATITIRWRGSFSNGAGYTDIDVQALIRDTLPQRAILGQRFQGSVSGGSASNSLSGSSVAVNNASEVASTATSLTLSFYNQSGVNGSLTSAGGNIDTAYGLTLASGGGGGSTTAETGSSIVTKLVGLTGNARLPYSAISGTPTIPTGLPDTDGVEGKNVVIFDDGGDGEPVWQTLQDLLTENISGSVGTVITRTSTGWDWSALPAQTPAETAISIRDKLETLTGNARLPYSAISGTPTIPAAETGASIVTKLGTLSGNARLPASSINGLPAAETGASIVTKLGTLSGDNRLPYSSISGTPTIPTLDTGAQIVAKLVALTGNARLPASAIRDLPSGGGSGIAETGATIKSKLEGLSGGDRLLASAIQGLPTGLPDFSTAPQGDVLQINENSQPVFGAPPTETAAQIVAKLQSLTGNQRLDASAIQNLPAGGGGTAPARWAELNNTDTRIPLDKFAADGTAGQVFTYVAATSGSTAHAAWRNIPHITGNMIYQGAHSVSYGTYRVGDVVIVEGEAFVCIQEHEANNVNIPGVANSTYWLPVGDLPRYSSADARKVLQVNTTGTATEWVEPPHAGLEFTDVGLSPSVPARGNIRFNNSSAHLVTSIRMNVRANTSSQMGDQDMSALLTSWTSGKLYLHHERFDRRWVYVYDITNATLVGSGLTAYVDFTVTQFSPTTTGTQFGGSTATLVRVLHFTDAQIFETGATLVSKLSGLTGDSRLPYSAISGTPITPPAERVVLTQRTGAAGTALEPVMTFTIPADWATTGHNTLYVESFGPGGELRSMEWPIARILGPLPDGIDRFRMQGGGDLTRGGDGNRTMTSADNQNTMNITYVSLKFRY